MKRMGIIVIMSLMIISGCGRKCAKSGCNNHATLDSRYCAWHSYTNSIPKKSSSTYSSSSSYSSSSTNSSKSSVKKYTSKTDTDKKLDIDDVDVETFYYDNIDEFEDIDDAWDYLEDDPDEADFYD
ncbi:hypothetical protein SAMN04487770_15010 [Butyrivibrio sp. ob235]|uniref:hypothetical protein n=1 Tax=Butyrivibrio sp. ob235 TaxID=1761780 RepID=UPI0008C441B5|nr:hypothetical protein [Butyrivibrio sp. ob235]SEM58953.1 hypothetical protein SAMN04487770_15010 [Butyrivibrio sp. ob235]